MEDNLHLNPVTEQWETKYPYKQDPAVLCKDGDNRAQVMSMTMKTEKRLMKNPELSKKYCEQFQDFIERGIFKEISNEELQQYHGPCRYSSHHEVFKEDSASTPVRLVLNSSLSYNGVSFNDILMKGPNALNNIWEVQLRFRSHAVALVCDLKKMYNSIKTTLTERYLRLVVWRDMNTDAEMKTYGTETVMFGDKPAAAIAAIALKQTAELYKHLDENAAAKIQNDMYMDDCATGESNMERVQKLKQSIKEILAKGGFHV
jgi:hypothetical protein